MIPTVSTMVVVLLARNVHLDGYLAHKNARKLYVEADNTVIKVFVKMLVLFVIHLIPFLDHARLVFTITIFKKMEAVFNPLEE